MSEGGKVSKKQWTTEETCTLIDAFREIENNLKYITEVNKDITDINKKWNNIKEAILQSGKDKVKYKRNEAKQQRMTREIMIFMEERRKYKGRNIEKYIKITQQKKKNKFKGVQKYQVEKTCRYCCSVLRRCVNKIKNKLFKNSVKTFQKKDVTMANIIGFGADGCNVMRGEHSVSSRFKEICPGIVIVKCIKYTSQLQFCHSARVYASEACKCLPQKCVIKNNTDVIDIVNRCETDLKIVPGATGKIILNQFNSVTLRNISKTLSGEPNENKNNIVNNLDLQRICFIKIRTHHISRCRHIKNDHKNAVGKI
ncbi:hypothetical protein FQA39_LY05050 [Lamprigera yunnana]|nr:hypothetical protein FQA39_LY05050 [Lamprigera yunnana]